MPIVIFFLVGMVAGAVRAYRLIVKSRQAGQRSGALHEWPAMPLSSWRYEPNAITAILVHTLSVLILSYLALRAASNPGILNNPLFANDVTMIALVWFIRSGSILIIGYQLGSLLAAFPLIAFRRKPVSAAITEKGMAYGRNLLPWRWFSHYSVDSDGGILRLYSAFASDLPSLTLKLPETVPLADLVGAVNGFLPSHPSQGSRAWYRTRVLLIPTMLLVCLAFIAVGWLASHLSQEASLFVIVLLTTLLVFLGGLVLNKFAFGVLNTRSSSAGQSPAA